MPTIQESPATAYPPPTSSISSDSIGIFFDVWHVPPRFYGKAGIIDPKKQGEEHFKTGLNAWSRCEKMLDSAPMMKRAKKEEL